MDTCIFCEILEGRGDASFVYRDDTCAAFLDVQPVNDGHILVIAVTLPSRLEGG